MSSMSLEQATQERYQERETTRQVKQQQLDELISGKGGNWEQIDDPERVIHRAERLGFYDEVRAIAEHPDDKELGAKIYEKIIATNNLLGVNFLHEGSRAARAIARVVLPVPGGSRLGTAFMVAPRVMMTNNHVLSSLQEAEDATLEFDFFTREDGATGPITRFRLQPSLLFLTDDALDFSVVAVEETNADGLQISDRGWHPLIPVSGKAVVGERVNIIQHPNGEPQRVAVHENTIVDVSGNFVHYVTDTMGGSSGSPVFNNEWDLVALHHAAVATSNEGIRISQIVTRLQEMLSSEGVGAGADLAQGLVDGSPPPAGPSTGLGAPIVPHSGPTLAADGTATWIVPVQISVGIGGTAAPRPSRVVSPASPRPIVLPPSAPVPLSAPTASDDQPIVFRAAEIREAWERFDREDELFAGATAKQREDFGKDVKHAITEIEKEEADADPGVMTVPQDQMASLMMSYLAEEPPTGSETEVLESGGLELKFARNDIFGWAGSVFDHVTRNRIHEIKRPKSTTPESIPNQARFALFADWGTNLYGAPAISSTLSNASESYDYLIHLGDVYYSGTHREVTNRFLNPWPRRDDAISRALNSNHEMYSGGHAYFERTFSSFDQESSYFALQNDHWLVICLDTGYKDHDLETKENKWVQKVFDNRGGRRVILMSHHQLFSWFDDQGPKLAGKLGAALQTGDVAAWYWGHEHRCCIYDPVPGMGNVRARCLGHGGMPKKRGDAQDLPEDHRQGEAIWRRHPGTDKAPTGLVLDGPNPFIFKKEKKYSPHGYMTIEFDGPRLIERVHDPLGHTILTRELL